MAKLSEGIISERLKSAYLQAKEAESEMERIANDTILQRRFDALKEYPFLVNDFRGKYEGLIGDGLLEFADNRKLMNFIFDQAIARPEILVDLAVSLGLTQRWFPLPGRRGKE